MSKTSKGSKHLPEQRSNQEPDDQEQLPVRERARQRWQTSRDRRERPVLLAYAAFRGALGAAAAVKALVEKEFAANNICVLVNSLAGDGVREIPVRVRTGIPLGVALSTPLGACVALALGQDLEHLLTGGFLGAVTGVVAGLGYWYSRLDFPARGLDARVVLVGVDLGAQGQLGAARTALLASGARAVEVRSKRDAIRALQRTAVRPDALISGHH